MALDPSRATPQPHVDPDPLSLPPPTLGAHPENARHPTSPSMFSSLAARRLSAASLVARATKPPSAGKGRSPGDESLLATGKLSSGEDARDDEGKDAMACPSAVTAVYGSVVTTEERSPAPPSSSGSSKNHKPRGTHRDDASLWLSGYSRYSRLRYSEAPESWEDDLFSPSPEGSIVTPDAGSPQAGVTSFPRVGPSPSPSSALAPSPSPSSAYPPPSPGGASDEDFISVRFGDDGGVDSILDERYMDMVSTGRERFDPQEQKQKRSPGSSESGSASPATTQTLGATPEEQSAPLAGASPGATEQQQQQRREDPRHATDLADNKTGFVARQEVRRESEVVKGGGCVAHHACAEEIRQTSSSTEWKEKTVRDEREKQARDDNYLVISRDDMRQSAVCHRLKPSANPVCMFALVLFPFYLYGKGQQERPPPGGEGGARRVSPRGVVSTVCTSIPPRSKLRSDDLDPCCRCHQSVRIGSVLTTRDTCTSVETYSKAVSPIGRGSPSFDSLRPPQ